MKSNAKSRKIVQCSLFDWMSDCMPIEVSPSQQRRFSIIRNHKKKLKRPDEYLAMVRQDGMSLVEVPDLSKNYDICLAAVKNNRHAFQFVPENLASAEVCVASLDYLWIYSHEPYKHIPYEVLHSDCFWDLAEQRLYIDAVKFSGTKLELVPEDNRTQEVCLIAVQRWGRALQFVPEIFKTPELCLSAILQDNRAIKYVPRKFFFRIHSKETQQPSKVSALEALQKIIRNE